MIKAYKYRLKLSKKQEFLIDSYINTSRAVYNLALETKIYAYKSHGISLSKFDLMRQLTECRKEFQWMKDVPVQTLQNSIERMDSAYKSFFRGGGFPKWAKKDKFNSVLFKSVSQISDYVFKLPKIGTVTVFKDRQPKGELRSATISRNNNKYYISILTKQEVDTSPVPNDNQVGIDMGITFFASLSTGEHLDNPRHTKKYERKLRIESRSLARKIKGSYSWRRQRIAVRKLHEKIANTRMDFLHKQSFRIANDFGFVAVEDLKVANMIKFGNLSKHILDASWPEFFRQLEYKICERGGVFVRVDPKHTSQTCSDCGSVDRMSRVSQAKFSCTSCGVEYNADTNASKVILSRGTAIVRQRRDISHA